MAKKTTKAASKTKTVKKSAPKKASTKKTSIKKTVAFDVNSDGKVDIEDVKIVMEEANKAKKITKKDEISELTLLSYSSSQHFLLFLQGEFNTLELAW